MMSIRLMASCAVRLTALGLALVAAACGGGTAPPTTPAGSTPSPQTRPATVALDAEVAATVNAPEEVADELRHLIAVASA